MPNWNITACSFICATSASDTAIGLALSGLGDNTLILGNEFKSNGIHIKLRHGGPGVRIVANDFYRARVGTGRIDIWVVPAPTTTNAGDGLRVVACKFGPEFLQSTDYRVLYADEGVGTHNGDRRPVFTPSTGVVRGHRFADSVVTNAPRSLPFVYSTTPHVRACSYGDMYLDGGVTHVLKYATAPGIDTSGQDGHLYNSSNAFGPFVYGGDVSVGLKPRPIASNDPAAGAILGGRDDYPTSPVDMLTASIANFTSLGGATRAAIPDAVGGTDAAEATMPAASMFKRRLDVQPIPGDPFWIEFDIAPAQSGSPLTGLKVAIQEDAGAYLEWASMVAIPASGWRRARLRVVTRSSPTGGLNVGFYTATAGTVRIGRVKAVRNSVPAL